MRSRKSATEGTAHTSGARISPASYRYEDTRKRGMAMVQFKAAYRAAGLLPSEAELPDFLAMVLDFAAAHPRGEKLLRAHRADLELAPEVVHEGRQNGARQRRQAGNSRSPCGPPAF